jgi:hypothetical protein
MRRALSIVSLAIGVALGSPSPAGASLLALETTSTMTVRIGFELPLVTFPINSSTATILVSSGVGAFTEPAGLFTGSPALPTALFTGIALINGLTLAVSNGPKQIAPFASGPPERLTDVIRFGGGLGGPGPLAGTAFVNVLGLFNLVIPLGVVGQTGATTTVTAGSLFVTVVGTGWTTAPVYITGVGVPNAGGFFTTGTVTAVGADNRTPGHQGTLVLVSAFKIFNNATRLPVDGIVTQTLSFRDAPEPATLGLAAFSAVCLVLHGLRRSRSRAGRRGE